MPSDFAGSTAEHYRRFRRDLPALVVDDLVERVGLELDGLALDLGAGTGQVAVPLAARTGTVLALEPEPAMAALLRARAVEEAANVLPVLASDRDLPLVARAVAEATCGLVTVANALHWMDAAAVFAAGARLLRPGGAIAVITHGVPLWLGEAGWCRQLGRLLEDWTGRRLDWSCGSDEAARIERSAGLDRVGLVVSVVEHRYELVVDAEYVIGHLYSAMSETTVPTSRRPEFEHRVRDVLASAGGPLVEDVPVTVLLGHRGLARPPRVSPTAAGAPPAG